MRRWISLVFVIALLGATPAARADKTDRSELVNGLKVLIRPIQGAPDVALMVLYSIGGDHDPDGRSGIAHMVEHLYVTAAAGETKGRTAQEFMVRYPGGWNAQTGDDYTLFAMPFPKGDLEKELKDAAARMGDLRLEEADLERERKRLLQELSNMFGGLPGLAASNLAGERIRPTPLGGRRGGVPEEVARITLQEVKERWERYYKPSNATLILAGDVDPGEVKEMIRGSFGPILPGDPAPKRHRSGKPLAGKTDVVPVKAIQPEMPSYACIAARPPPPTSDLYAPYLIFVGRMFQANQGAPPPKPPSPEMPRGYAPLLDDPNKVFISAALLEGESPSDARKRLEEFLAGVIEPKLQTGDVDRVKGTLGFLLWPDAFPELILAQNLCGVAFSLGRRAQLGIDSEALGKALEGVTEADLRRAAKEVFGEDRRAAVIAKVEQEEK